MPKIQVEIEWDSPEDKGWLNIYNILERLQAYCGNTKFSVTELIRGHSTKEEK